MAQTLKDDVKERIARAALIVFAREGFPGATMSTIAREAGVATGNLYRYYPSKEDLFQDAVSPAFVRRLTTLLKKRVTAVRGVDDLRTLPPRATFHAVAEELLLFAIANRHRMLVLLGKSAGTPYADFPEQLGAMLERLAIAHFRARHPQRALSQPERLALRLVYRNLLAAVVAILSDTEDPEKIREAVDAYSRYHLAGLKHLFEKPAASNRE